jgi:uncharacterized membrane protein YphA (DoxX/SURF4 family)
MSIIVVGAPGKDATEERWSLADRAAFRFACVYFGIYLLSEWLVRVPGLGAPARAYSRAWQALELWTGRHILHISTPIDVHTLGTGSGDTLIDYLQLLCQLVFTAAATLVWSVSDAKRPSYGALNEWLRVYIRYSLAVVMLSYGMAKVFPGQFGYPTLDRLVEPYGHSSPMGLLWTFMGYSRPYALFTGVVECVGGLLLFSQRTTTLGALVVAAAMGNVAMLNFSYDVPVKLYSSHLFLLAAILVAPDLSRLARVFITNQPVAPAPRRKPFTTVWRSRTALAVKAAVIGGALWQTTAPFIVAGRRPARPRAARYGIYDVESFIVNGERRGPAPMDGTRWRRVIISENGGVSVQTMDDAMTRYRTKEDAAKHTFELSTIFSPYDKIVLAYSQPSAEELALEGNYQGEAIAVRLRKVPTPPFLLNQREFHWINEYPYNR